MKGHKVIGECSVCGKKLYCCERVTIGFGALELFRAHEGCAVEVRAMYPEIEHVDMDDVLRGRAS